MTVEVPIQFYESAAKIYPRAAHGRYARLRVLAMLALLGIYYALPWISIGDTPLVWFDLPHRRFHVFGLMLAPQDLIYLAWMLLIAALTLFFFTTLAGRVWCGYACPQTVWTQAFLWMEHFTEGDRYARIKLDRAPWGINKIVRKGSKQLLWAVFALFTGLTFVAYFVPARELFPAAAHLQLGGWTLFWTLFYGLATWGNAGFLREQVCKYMCPYARFQSAMFDRDTLIVAYDGKRGEPRKNAARKLARMAAPATLVAQPDHAPAAPALKTGDCIDCSLCVQVCPVGIDIREGLQYECISCAACVDVCNGVMDSVGKPQGLIRYTSAHHEAGKPFHLIRPRTIGYGLIWAVLCAGFLFAIAARTPLEFDVMRDRHTLYRELADGAIENLYLVKLSNKDRRAHALQLDVRLSDGSPLKATPNTFRLNPGESRSVMVSVRTEGERPTAISTTTFTLRAEDDPSLNKTRSASFLAGH